MDPALYISMMGAKRSLAEQGVYSNNLANVNTLGFKQDLYQAESLYLNGAGLPSQVFTVAKESAVNFKAGPLMTTNRDLDVAIRGDGWFVIQNDNSQQALTRKGSFSINSSGLLSTADGHLVMGEGGPISIPPYQSLQIAEDGTISVVPKGELPNSVSILDRLLLVKPANQQLVKGVDGYIYPRGGSNMQADSTIRIATNSLEGSNVSSVEQMIKMISSSKEFETQLKLMKNIDENQDSLARLLQI